MSGIKKKDKDRVAFVMSRATPAERQGESVTLNKTETWETHNQTLQGWQNVKTVGSKFHTVKLQFISFVYILCIKLKMGKAKCRKIKTQQQMLSSMHSLVQQFNQQIDNHQTIILHPENIDMLYMSPTFLPCPTWGLSQ